MAGYSSTPLAKKLGIKPDTNIIFINEPQTFKKDLGALPQGTKFLKRYDRSYLFDYIHFFTDKKSDLKVFFNKAVKSLEKDGMIWISWPKKSAKVKTDLDENIIRELGLKVGLVDVKVAAVDDTWSALKFVIRLKDR